MKFVLMLSICSFVLGECKDPIKYPENFDTWKDCAIIALDTSIKYLEDMDSNTVNELQLSTQYSCKPQDTI
jgi:hypothetical protein|tara:strand:- start:1111 stop:1323 length:213 start_codon:yes stop_codon:yes gene_type:complete